MIVPVLFIHGAGDGAFSEDRKLAECLQDKLGHGYEVRYPAMPDEDDVNYDVWRERILQDVERMDEAPVLVGHSVGASVLIKIFTTPGPKPTIAGMFLVAGPFWYDHEFWRWDEVKLTSDAGENYPKDTALFAYHGESDESVPVTHLEMLVAMLPQIIAQRLPGRDHQLNGDMTEVARDISQLITAGKVSR